MTGIGIAESAVGLAHGVSNGDWVEAGLGGIGVGLEVLSMVIDPAGTLLSYGVEVSTPDGETVAEQVDFVWDGTVLAEQVHNGSTTTTWDWEPGRFRPVAQVERRRAGQESQEWVDARFYSIVTDLVGMPTELVDEGGNLAWRQQTTLWGEALSRIGREADIPFRFSGQYFDAETGLHYNYHRYYDPTTGRYITHDPLDLAPSPNTQGYVRNPTGWIDPFGLAENCDFPNQKPEDFDAEMEVARRNGVTPTTPGTPEFDAMIAAGTVR